jgi:hypothetical protein
MSRLPFIQHVRLLSLSCLLLLCMACSTNSLTLMTTPQQPPNLPRPAIPSFGGISCFIQSTLGPQQNNFEAVVLDGHSLVHYFRDNTNVSNPWHKGQVITTNASGPGCIIQSTLGGDHNNFEVVVPEFSANGGQQLVHYFHNNTDVSLPWIRAQVIDPHVSGPGCIIQSTFGGNHNNFEVVVPEATANGGQQLVHYFHDNTNVSLPWTRAQVIDPSVSGPGCMIQSTFGGDHNNFEVVVPEAAPRGGQQLVHYFHDNTNVNLPWTRAQVVDPHVAGPGCIIQGTFGGAHNNFEVVVPEPTPDGGQQLVHYFHDNTDVSFPWTRAQIIAPHVTGPGCLIQSTLGGNHNNFEVLVPEVPVNASGRQQLAHYFHDNTDVHVPWTHAQIIDYAGQSQKICQLTGDQDRELGQGTVNQTDARYGLYGTDEGSSFSYNGNIYFYFGDTVGTQAAESYIPNPASSAHPPAAVYDDSTAYTSDTTPEACLHLQFVTGSDGHYCSPHVPGITLGSFETPFGGFSANGKMYVFFGTDGPPAHAYASRSVLASSSDGGKHFANVHTISSNKFVSVFPTVVNNGDFPGLPQHTGQGVLLWGSTVLYRAGDAYLAYVPMNAIDSPEGAIRYYAGLDGSGDPRWSTQESDATALFEQPCIGELSSTYNPFLHEWLMLYNCGNPRGINYRVAQMPWGAWSPSGVLFDPRADGGYCFFMHAADQTPCDQVSDPQRETTYGGEYGPYVIPQYTTGISGQSTTIYFVMSTWNPYEVMLMRCTLKNHA